MIGIPPVIILGMHRSGTTLLTKILENLGLFIGWKKEKNYESIYFLKFNKWVLEQANITWDNLYNYRFIHDPFFEKLTVALAEKYIKSIRRIEYLGLLKTLKYKSLKDLDFPWGWKDPRNIITLNIWLKVFPDAKIIHIYRNPIDVAQSLRNRVITFEKSFKWTIKRRLKFFLLKGYIGYNLSLRTKDIYEGIKLWEEYISNVLDLEKKLGIDILHIKYEKLLESPFKEIRTIVNKINLKVEEKKIKRVINTINSNRKYAFLSNEELVEVYKTIKNNKLFKLLGYNNLLLKD